MRVLTAAKSRAKGCAAPAPGVYSGTFNGVPAVFSVVSDAVYASYYRLTASHQVVPTESAWDILNGRFFPTAKGDPARCSIRISSRTLTTSDTSS